MIISDCDAITSKSRSFYDAPRRLIVLGGACSGKSTALRFLLGDGIELPVNAFSRQISCEIVPGTTTTYQVGGRSVLPASIAKLPSDTGVLHIAHSSPFLSETNCVISEVAEFDCPPGKEADLTLAEKLGMCDACLYIINAQMAYSKSDATIIKYLCDVKVSVFVAVSGFEKLDPVDRGKVKDYVEKILPHSETLVFDKSHDNLRACVEGYREGLIGAICSPRKDRLACFSHIEVRRSIHMLEKEYALEKARSEEMVRKASAINRNKLASLDERDKALHRIVDGLNSRWETLKTDAKRIISDYQKTVIKIVSHDIEVSPDARAYWDKTLAFRLESLFSSKRPELVNLINQHANSALAWAQQEFRRIKYSTPPNSSCRLFSLEIATPTIDGPNINNLERVRLIVKGGQAVLLLAVGTALASTGITATVMALSVITGYGTKWIVDREEQKNKARAIELLPVVVRELVDRITIDLTETINTQFSEMTNAILDAGRKCYLDEKTEIDCEYEKALYNCRVKAESIRKEIENLKNK